MDGCLILNFFGKRKLCGLLPLLFFLFSISASATNTATTSGDFNDEDIWSSGEIPIGTDTPGVTIVSSWVYAACTNMDFTINSDIEVTAETITVNSTSYSALKVSQNNTVTISGTLTLGSSSSSLNLYNSGTIIVKSGATLEIYGDLQNEGTIIVEEGGTLIVHGSIDTDSNNASFTISGDVVVSGNFKVHKVTINSTGNVVVGEDFWCDNNGGSSTISGNLYVFGDDETSGHYTQGDTKNKSDFEDEADDDLYDIAASLGLVSAKVDAPTKFTYKNLDEDAGTVTLTWDQNTAGDDILLVYSESSISFTPSSGTDYSSKSSGYEISDGVYLVCVGDYDSYDFSSLVTDGTTYFKIWSVNSSYEYSEWASLKIGSSSSTVFYEDFETPNYSWTASKSNSNGPPEASSQENNTWTYGDAVSYRGDNAAYVTNNADGDKDAAYDMDFTVTGPPDQTYYVDYICSSSIEISSDYLSAQLQFYWKGMGESGADYGSVLIGTSTDNMSVISSDEYCSGSSWTKETINLDDYVGETVYLGFRFYYDNEDGEDPGFCVDEVKIVGSTVEAPSDFAGTATSATTVDLSWNLNENGDDVVVVYSAYGVIGEPESGTDYSVGDILSGGGEVIYVGSEEEYTQTVDASGTLDYAIWSVSSSNYSSGLYTTVQLPVSLPYSEDFEDDDDVDEWSFGTSDVNDWTIGTAVANNGSQSAYISTDKGATATYDVDYESTADLSIAVDLNDYTDATMTFYFECNGVKMSNDAYGQILVNHGTNTQTINVTYNGHSQQQLSGVSSWTSASVDLSSYVDNVVTISFEWYNKENATENDPGFCVDDINITGTIEDPESLDTYNDGSSSDILLSWGLNDANDTIMVAYSEDEDFDTPEEGTYYDEDYEFDGGATVIYKGTEEGTDIFTHTPLSYSTIYYYKAWSTRNGLYSSGITASENTPDKVTLIDYDWDGNTSGDITYPETSSNSNYWTSGSDVNNTTDGSISAYITNNGTDAQYSTKNSSTSDLTFDLDMSDMETCTVSFDWKCKGAFSPNENDQNGYGLVELYDGSSTYYYLGTDGSIYTDSNNENCRFKSQTSWTTVSVDLEDYDYFIGNDFTLIFHWYNNSKNNDKKLGFCIDDVEAGGIYTATSTIAKNSSFDQPSTISSIINSEDDAVDVFEFTFNDESDSYNDVAGTNITEFKITKGDVDDGKEIDDWRDAIAGAILRPSGDTSGENDITGVVSNNSITFTGDIAIAEGESETYQLYAYLNEDLNGNDIEDGDEFNFVLSSDDITTGEGDDFESNEIESGAVAIDVEATAIEFDQEPSSYASYNVALTDEPIVAAVDANGNIDVDESGSVTIANSGSLTMSTSSADFSEGLATFTDLTFTDTDEDGTTVTLTASYSDFTDVKSTSITIDDYDTPTSISNDDFYINQVIFEDINNTSGKDDDGYGSYVDQTTELVSGETYDITLGVYDAYKEEGTPPTSYDGYVYVYIDWDQDGEFDSDEEYVLSDYATYSTSIQSLTESDLIEVPDDAEAGSTRMRILFNAIPEEMDNGQLSSTATSTVSYASEYEDYTVIISDQTWLGYTTKFGKKSNWSNGVVPDGTDVYITSSPKGGKFPVIEDSETEEITSLELQSGAAFTVDAGGTLSISGALTIGSEATMTLNAGSYATVSGDLITNDGLTVNNDLTDGSEAISSIIIDGDVTGDATEVWSNIQGYYWWYLSNPVSGDYSNEYENYSETAGGSSSYYIRLYNNSSLKYDYNISTSSYSFDALDAFGYAVLNNNSDNTLTYSGTFNNKSSYSHEATNESTSSSYYQYIGNPYPSYIDYNAIYTNSTLTAAKASTCYVYTTITEGGVSVRGYATYNAEKGVYTNANARYIAPGQCFWVQMITGDIVYINKSVCTNSYDTEAPVSLKSTSSSSSAKPMIRLALSNDNTYDEVLIIGDEEYGSDNITKYDSQKKMNSGVIGNLYTVKNDTSIAINSLPEFYDGDIIPLGYSVSSSGMTDFTIKVASLTNTDDYSIYLDDLDDGTSVELTDTTEYTFTPSEASSDDRFQIRIASSESTEEGTTTGIEETASDNISVYSSGQTAYVTVSDEWLQSNSRKIYVYDVAGQLVQTEELDDLDTQFTLPGEGVYLVKVVSGSMIYNQKVLGQ